MWDGAVQLDFKVLTMEPSVNGRQPPSETLDTLHIWVTLPNVGITKLLQELRVYWELPSMDTMLSTITRLQMCISPWSYDATSKVETD